MHYLFVGLGVIFLIIFTFWILITIVGWVFNASEYSQNSYNKEKPTLVKILKAQWKIIKNLHIK